MFALISKLGSPTITDAIALEFLSALSVTVKVIEPGPVAAPAVNVTTILPEVASAVPFVLIIAVPPIAVTEDDLNPPAAAVKANEISAEVPAGTVAADGAVTVGTGVNEIVNTAVEELTSFSLSVIDNVIEPAPAVSPAVKAIIIFPEAAPATPSVLIDDVPPVAVTEEDLNPAGAT